MNGDFQATCSTCKYYRVTAGRGTEGLCRRYPPQVVVASVDTPDGVRQAPVAVMPNMRAQDWCGEYKSKALI
jgi:hypothetical protein